MKVFWTEHAERRAKERSGHTLHRLSRQIEEAVRKCEVYRPSARRFKRGSDHPNEMWVVVDGPIGRATAVVYIEDEEIHVVTVRDSESCSQGGSTLRKPGNFPFKDLLQKHLVFP